MKFRQFIFIILLSLLGLQFVIGQEKPKAILVDEVLKTCSEDMMSRIQNSIHTLQSSPNQKVYIYFYGNETTEGRNLYFAEWLKFYIFEFQKIDKSRVEILRGANGKVEKTQFWSVPFGTDPPQLEKEFSPLLFTNKTRFDSGSGYVNPYTKQIESGYYDLGCGFRPNLKEFAKILSANQNLTGEIIVNNQNKRESNQVAYLIVKELTKTHKVPRNRFKLQYRYQAEFGETELWIVQKK